MTTHTDLIARLRDHFCDMSESDYTRAANALEAQDTTITALRAEVAALTRAVDTDYEQLFREEAAKVAALKERLQAEREKVITFVQDYSDEHGLITTRLITAIRSMT